MNVRLEQIIYTKFAGLGFKILKSTHVTKETQQTFIKLIAQCREVYNPSKRGYQAVYLYQLSPEQNLFGWVYNDWTDDRSSQVPYLICYSLSKSLHPLQLEDIFTCLHKGPVALIAPHSLPVVLEPVNIPDFKSYQSARPGVAIPADIRQRCQTVLSQGKLIDLFVNQDEQQIIIKLNNKIYEKSANYANLPFQENLKESQYSPTAPQQAIAHESSSPLSTYQNVHHVVENESGTVLAHDNTVVETIDIQPSQEANSPTSQKRKTILLLLCAVLSGCITFVSLWLITKLISGRTAQPLSQQFVSEPSATVNYLEERMSGGDKILVLADATAQKNKGVQALKNGNFVLAIASFQASLQQNPNDPETLIYLNNAKAAQQDALKIAVSVPIGGSLDAAQEILRGVAQAQNEVNQSGGINGALLQVEIANDDNNPILAKELAAEFVKDSSILAVVGHNSSDASLAAAPVYQRGRLVMISGTSYATKLSSIGSYIFRTVPRTRSTVEILSLYALKNAQIKNIAICADSTAAVSQSLKQEFVPIFLAHGGKVVSESCDFSAPDFNPKSAISRAISAGAYGMLLLPSVDSVNQAIDVMKSNKARLKLIGSHTLYTFKTLQMAQASSNGMVLAVLWHPTAFPENDFPQRAVKLWKGQVNWRSATSYDATMAIVAGLKSGNTSREALQKALSNPKFSVDGATGKVQFLPSGDRKGKPHLVIVEPGNASGTGYDFVPLS